MPNQVIIAKKSEPDDAEAIAEIYNQGHQKGQKESSVFLPATLREALRK